jgi:hypothetical protein
VRAARITLLCILALFFALAVCQCAERTDEQGKVLSTLLAADELAAPPVGGSLPDSLAIEQDGITLVQRDEARGIFCYQSSWSVSQSRVLVERALLLQGWQTASEEGERMITFLFAPSATADGGTLLVSMYERTLGCSILAEYL